MFLPFPSCSFLLLSLHLSLLLFCLLRSEPRLLRRKMVSFTYHFLKLMLCYNFGIDKHADWGKDGTQWTACLPTANKALGLSLHTAQARHGGVCLEPRYRGDNGQRIRVRKHPWPTSNLRPTWAAFKSVWKWNKTTKQNQLKTPGTWFNLLLLGDRVNVAQTSLLLYHWDWPQVQTPPLLASHTPGVQIWFTMLSDTWI